jgi:predicted adenine nucleotide alpha hydrolase (AANH) superfamily ATPase
MISKLNHVFIETIPDELEEGILYISLRFRVIMHSCCCGCKSKVVTPLSPARWKMTFDGKTISLNPSIGNWNFDCQSHYWIEKSEVEWAGKWTNDEIAEGKSYEKEKRANYYKAVNKLKKNTEQLDENNFSNFFKNLVGKIIKK